MKANVVWTRDNGPDGTSDHVLGTVEAETLQELGAKALEMFPYADPSHPNHVDGINLVEVE